MLHLAVRATEEQIGEFVCDCMPLHGLVRQMFGDGMLDGLLGIVMMGCEMPF